MSRGRMLELLDWGIDGLIVSDPALATDVLSFFNEGTP